MKVNIWINFIFNNFLALERQVQSRLRWELRDNSAPIESASSEISQPAYLSHEQFVITPLYLFLLVIPRRSESRKKLIQYIIEET